MPHPKFRGAEKVWGAAAGGFALFCEAEPLDKLLDQLPDTLRVRQQTGWMIGGSDLTSGSKRWRLVLPAALLLGLISPAWAGWDEGHNAFARGDYATAFQEWLPLAKNGHAEAQLNLGFIYNQGLGISQDDTEAAKWYRRAAEQGLVEAQAELGTAYFHGLGVPQDYAEAEKWSRKAAVQGHPTGQFNLGSLYVYGLAVPRNYSVAAMWFRKAADQGDAASQLNLAILFAQGLGGSQDNVKALMWLAIAASQPNDPARGAPDIVSSAIELGAQISPLMTPAQIAEAKRLAREWKLKKR